jgi:hypothetical protein
VKWIPSAEKLSGLQSKGGRSVSLAGLFSKTFAKQETIVLKFAAYQYGWQRLSGGESRI